MSLNFTPLGDALASLGRGLARRQHDPADEEVRDACIQRFEYCFELSWKMLKRQIEAELDDSTEVDSYSKRTLFRGAAERGLIESPEPWFVYLVQRKRTSHTYDAKVAAEVAAVLDDFARDARALLVALTTRHA
ncbi:MAG: nucleotidyltransferase [Betaproteobacteria bacterium HGW-Betaproteobacteria-3]|jgi:nucleotidyltransferase substrate binding protein (TIGR01987 family)|nr:MAG: nucleotidyltransferase [Betaproteobacteria bacterium HGW-Betaproteobacteria-3]